MSILSCRAHHAGCAHDTHGDIDECGVPDTGRIRDDVAAVGQGRDRRFESLVRAPVDNVVPDEIQRGIKDPNVEVVVQSEYVDERDRDVAVGQHGDRRHHLISIAELTDLDLAADLVAGGIVTLADNGEAVGVYMPLPSTQTTT